MTIIITTFGEQSWQELAFAQAYPSAEAQAPTVTFHAPLDVLSLGEARNRAVDFHDPQGWLLFLDADDQLSPGYVAFMEEALGDIDELLVPAIQYFRGRSAKGSARTLHDRDILKRNPCPIGTMIHRDVFEDVGRFWHEAAYEDWSLFRRAVLSGCELKFVPAAIYRAQMSPNGRNSTVKYPERATADIVKSHDRWLADR